MEAPPTGVVTFFLTDIEGSTEHWGKSWDGMSTQLQAHDATLRGCIEAQNGYVVKGTGDGFLAAFNSPYDGLSAALATQRELRDNKIDLLVRTALHSGQAEERDGDYFGQPVNRVARLLSAGHGGQILLTRPTRDHLLDRLPPDVQLVDLGEHHLRDLSREEQVYQVVVPDLRSDFPPLISLGTQPNNLPLQRTPFVGRAAELVDLQKLLENRTVRLVTLIGPGGAGKSRLGLETATQMLDSYQHGVFFVPLATISSPDAVDVSIAHALHVQERGNQSLVEALTAYLSERDLLLVLDNFEHVLAARSLVARLLDACPRLQIMVTSRAPLRLAGEHRYPVRCLAFPEPPPPPPAELSQYEAVELFIQQAQMVWPDFAVTNENAPAVSEICSRLDGLPLAIKLAAARSESMTPQEILARLSLKLLTKGDEDENSHHATLRDTIDWSYELLDPAERLLLCRLAIFVGTFGLEAAEAVCDPDGDLDAMDRLDALVQKSLVRRAGRDTSRYSLLQTIREFALAQANESASLDGTRRRHAEYYRDLVVLADPKLRGPDQVTWLNRLGQEHANVQAALEYAVECGDASLGMELAGCASRYWDVRGYLSEGRHWLERTLALGTAPATVRARALRAGADIAWRQADYDDALRYLEESLTLSREADDTGGEAAGLSALGGVMFTQGNLDEAETKLNQSLELRRRLGDTQGVGAVLGKLAAIEAVRGDFAAALPLSEQSLALRREVSDAYGISSGLRNIGMIALGMGNFDRSGEAFEESAEWCRRIGDRRGLASSNSHLALVLIHRGETERAAQLLRDSLQVTIEVGDRVGLLEALEGLGWTAAAEGDLTRAARLCGAAARMRESIRTRQPPYRAQLHQAHRAALAPTRSGAAWDAAEREGRSMSLEDAVAYALGGGANEPVAVHT